MRKQTKVSYFIVYHNCIHILKPMTPPDFTRFLDMIKKHQYSPFIESIMMVKPKRYDIWITIIQLCLVYKSLYVYLLICSNTEMFL